MTISDDSQVYDDLKEYIIREMYFSIQRLEGEFAYCDIEEDHDYLWPNALDEYPSIECYDHYEGMPQSEIDELTRGDTKLPRYKLYKEGGWICYTAYWYNGTYHIEPRICGNEPFYPEVGYIELLAHEMGLIKNSDTGAIDSAIDNIVALNPKPLQDYIKGKKAAKMAVLGMIKKQNKDFDMKMLEERFNQKITVTG